MNSTLSRLLIAGSAIAAGLMAAVPIHAASFAPGALIKISSLPDVYYYGVDAKRYVFPNEKTYFSWYSGFNTQMVSPGELAAVPVGGAVTERPGARMVKVTTDPKVYAVAKGGVLRWVQTETVAAQLYGTNWAHQVDDVPDAYFATYKLGAVISYAYDYSPSAELAAATTISEDKGLIPPGTPTPTPQPTPTPTPTPTTTASLILNVSATTVRPGDTELLTAYASHPSGIVKIDLYFDGHFLVSCTSSTCSREYQLPLAAEKPSYEARAVATALDNTTQTKIVTVPLSTSASSLLKLTVPRASIRSGDLAEAVIDSDHSIEIIQTLIYVNNNAVKNCPAGAYQCRWSDVLTGPIGTTFDVHGQVKDSIGRTYQSAHKIITIASNDSPVVMVDTGKYLIYQGETIDVTATASDPDGIGQIQILKDGVVLKTCSGPSPCTLTTGPWNTAGTITFAGQATDLLGLTANDAFVTVTVQ